HVRRPVVVDSIGGGGGSTRATVTSLSSTQTPGSFVARKVRLPSPSFASFPVRPIEARRGHVSPVGVKAPSGPRRYFGRASTRKNARGSTTSPPSSTPWNEE